MSNLNSIIKIKENNIQIFIPTYNRDILVKRAIQSCLNQKYGNIKVIVLDNCSDDRTEEVCNSIKIVDSRLEYKKNSSNLGMLGNFNQIKNLITGDYFCFLTDDDVYESNFILDALQLLESHPTAIAAVMDAPTRSGNLLLGSQLKYWKEGLYSPCEGLEFVLSGKHPIITNCLFKKEFATEFYFDERLGGGGDVFILTKLFLRNNVVVSKKISGYYDLHESNHSLITRGIDRIYQKKNLHQELTKLLWRDDLDLRFFDFNMLEVLKLIILYDTYQSLLINFSRLHTAFAGKPHLRLTIIVLRIKIIFYGLKNSARFMKICLKKFN